MNEGARTRLGHQLGGLRRRIIATGIMLKDWEDLIDEDLAVRIAEARAEGFVEGETKQAILELQAQDRFLAETKCKNCGHPLNGNPPPAEEPKPMTIHIATLIAKLKSDEGCVKTWSDVEADLTALVSTAKQAQARKDAKIAGDSDFGDIIEAEILKAAGLAPAPEPAPPAEEPMTVARVDARLDSGCYDQDPNDCGSVHNLTADLTALLQAQARRDAKVADDSHYNAGPLLANDIRKAAGLK